MLLMDDMKSGVRMDTYKCGGVGGLGKTFQRFKTSITDKLHEGIGLRLIFCRIDIPLGTEDC